MVRYEKESGVGVRGTVRVPARGMTSRSVRKRQQPPSLERQEIMLRRWKDLVNRPSISSGSQVAGIGSYQTILLARGMRPTKLRSSDARNEGQTSLEKWRKDRNEECVGRAQWKINEPPSLRDNARAWREPTLFMVCDGRTHIGMNQADLEKEDCR